MKEIRVALENPLSPVPIYISPIFKIEWDE